MDIFAYLEKHNIKVNDKKLIQEAFVHTSYLNEHKLDLHDNERLEFMGDAVLQIYSAERLFKIEPALKEGIMSTRRSNLVSEPALALVAKENHLNDFLMLGVGEEKNGGRDKDSIVSDMFEAFIGALYLDQGQEVIYRYLDELMLKHINQIDESTFDYKTKLQEYVQADTRKSIVYETISQSGPNNKPSFEVVCKIDGLIYGKGVGVNKKQAQKNAAKDALEKMAKL